MAGRPNRAKSIGLGLLVLVSLVWNLCCGVAEDVYAPFDSFGRELSVSPWLFRFRVENQNMEHGDGGAVEGWYYLKASVSISHSASGESLLHAVSEDEASYSANYHYLSFEAGQDLFLDYGSEPIYPLGYVFEPSLGLAGFDRLVYTFRISVNQYDSLRARPVVSYWFIDRMAGLGRLCFTSNISSDEI